MHYDGNIIRKFYIPQLSRYKLFSIMLLQSIIESALYKLRVININQINRFELNILLQASYVDIILSSFYTRIKAICPWHGKRRNIYEREFINQKKTAMFYASFPMLLDIPAEFVMKFLPWGHCEHGRGSFYRSEGGKTLVAQ